MKIANVLTASVVVAFASLLASVGCSSPTSAPVGGANSADSTGSKSNDSGDDDSKSSSTPSSSTPASSTSTTTTNTSTTAPTGGSACDSCLTSKSTKLAAEFKCEDACAETDDSCFDNCWTTNCGDSESNECTQAEDSCQTQCTPTQAQLQQCETCITGLNAKAGAFAKCADACGDDQDGSCEDKCWTSSGCSSDENSCNSALSSDSCATACGDAH